MDDPAAAKAAWKAFRDAEEYKQGTSVSADYSSCGNGGASSSAAPAARSATSSSGGHGRNADVDDTAKASSSSSSMQYKNTRSNANTLSPPPDRVTNPRPITRATSSVTPIGAAPRGPRQVSREHYRVTPRNDSGGHSYYPPVRLKTATGEPFPKSRRPNPVVDTPPWEDGNPQWDPDFQSLRARRDSSSSINMVPNAATQERNRSRTPVDQTAENRFLPATDVRARDPHAGSIYPRDQNTPTTGRWRPKLR